jgi:hypothetical protein
MNSAENREAIRSKYLEFGSGDWARIAQLILDSSIAQSIGMRVEEQNGERRIVWNTMEEDFAAFDDIFNYIVLKVAHQEVHYREDDEVFWELFQRSPMLRSLNSSSIETSGAHTITPFEHTIQVYKQIIANAGMDYRQQILVLCEALGHDIGKLVIAKGDEFQDHATISSEVLKQYLMARGFMKEDAIKLLAPVTLHHLAENVEKEIIAPEEAATLVDDQEIAQILSILTLADGASSEAHLHFAAQNANVLIQALRKKFEAVLGQSKELITAYVHALIGLLNKLKEKAYARYDQLELELLDLIRLLAIHDQNPESELGQNSTVGSSFRLATPPQPVIN